MKANLFRNGMIVDINGSVVQVVEFEHLPNNMINVKAKNLLTKQMVALQINANDELTQIRLEKKTVSYSYEEDGKYYFLDSEVFEVIAIEKSAAPRYFEYVEAGEDCILETYRGKIYNVIPPRTSTMKVVGVKNGIATLENGAEIKVPGIVKVGDRIVIDTLVGEFREVL